MRKEQNDAKVQKTMKNGTADFKDKKVLKTLILLSIPTIIEEMLSTLLQYVDTAMVGRLGEQATAAVSVTTTITWLIGSVSSAAGVAALTLISQAFGRRDEEMIHRISKQAVLWALVIGCVLEAAALACSPFIPGWMGAEQEVQREASAYFFIICLPLVLRTLSRMMGAALRAVQDTKSPMIVSLLQNSLNVCFNYVLIYQLQMGVRGAAVASAISYLFAGAAMWMVYHRNSHLRWHDREVSFDRDILKKGLQISIPVMGTSTCSCLGYVFFAAMVSGMGTTVFAAHSIAVTAETIFYIPGYGLRTATSALVGASLGERNRQKFEKVCQVSVLLTLGMMLFSGILLYCVAEPLMYVFTISENVARLGARMLCIVAFTEPFFGLMIVLEGIFYGLGKTGYAFGAETLSMWGIRIFFTFLCTQIWHLGLEYVWYCMIADNIVKALLFTLPMLNAKRRSRLWKGE